MIFRVLKVFLALISAAALLVIAVFVAIYLPGMHKGANLSSPAAQDFSRTDFITIVLTTAALMLAALGLILALAGAIGYVTIRTAAESAAEKAAERAAGTRAETVATRLVRELVPQLIGGSVQAGSDEDDAFTKAEGER